MPVKGPFTALGTKWAVKRRAAIGADSLRSACGRSRFSGWTAHNADAFSLFCFAKYQNTGTPASITSIIPMVPNSE